MSSVPEKVQQLFQGCDAPGPTFAFASPGSDTFDDGTLFLINGEVKRWTGATSSVLSPICYTKDDGTVEQRVLGSTAQLTTEESLRAVEAAVTAVSW